MDTLLNIRAFLTIADVGSLSGAARKLGVAPSVISKRIGRLEDEMGAILFVRTTRKLEITPIGERFLPRYQELVRNLDDTLRGARNAAHDLEGHLRIKCPTTIGISYFGDLFSAFQAEHQNVSIDLTLLDRSVNPNEEGFDIALGGMPTTYEGVTDVSLGRHPRILCASPEYVERRGYPSHPQDLSKHDCLMMQATGTDWLFDSDQGDISVSIQSRLSVNDGQVLRNAACKGYGITIIGEYVARTAIAEGRLIQLLPQFPVKSLWLKALIPNAKIDRPVVKAMIQRMRDFTQPIAPWDREDGDFIST